MSQFDDDGERLFWEEYWRKFQTVSALVQAAEQAEEKRLSEKLYQHPRNRIARLLRRLADKLEKL